MIKPLIHERFITLSGLIVVIGLSCSCSNDQNEKQKENIQNEFVQTYLYVIENNLAENNLSHLFTKMRNSNPDTFISISFRWYDLATNSCDLKNSSYATSNITSYEKMLAESRNVIELTKITNKDRQCLANVFATNWQQINNMLTLHYPKIR